MELDTKQDRQKRKEIKAEFDRTLCDHFERLTGSRDGTGGLPLNLTTIACLVLIAERETEIESFHSSSPDRHTHESILEELNIIGIKSDEDVNRVLRDMTEKGYIEMADDGRFTAGNPTIDMVHLFDNVFPGMPRMKLLACHIQSRNEVLSGQQDLKSGLKQFNQILQIQGVPFIIERIRPEPDKVPRPSYKRKTTRKADLSRNQEPQINQKKNIKVSDTFSRMQVETRPKGSETRVLSSDGSSRPLEIRGLGDLFSKGDDIEEPAQKTETAIDEQKFDLPEEEKAEVSVGTLSDTPSEPDTATEDSAGETVSSDTPLEDIPAAREKYVPPSDSMAQETKSSKSANLESEEIESVQEEDALQPPDPEYGAEIISDGHALDGADDTVDDRISAFERDLAMQCPICKSGRIEKEETTADKVYYKCSSKKCIFISWGKPYHLACPLCNNPFLVESSQKDGKTILNCPRSTCRHWQKLPGEIPDEPQEKPVSPSQEPIKSQAVLRKPLRKVKRRRVVRRKR